MSQDEKAEQQRLNAMSERQREDELLVGVDLAEMGRQAARELEADLPNHLAAIKRDEETYRYQQNKVKHVIAMPLNHPSTGRPGFIVSAVEPWFGVGVMKAWDHSIESAKAELLFGYGEALFKAKMFETRAACMDYAAGFELVLDHAGVIS